MAKWHCQVCGHKWESTPSQWLGRKKAGCKQCAHNAWRNKKQTKRPTFAESSHPLMAEWDHQRNATQGHSHDTVMLRSAKHIFWLCTKCSEGQEHSWSAQPFQRTSRLKTGCPFCAGKVACECNSLQGLYPDTAAEWNYSKNQGQPSDHTAGSHHLAWWSTPHCGSWQQTINSRTAAERKSAK
ncbi:hypothetical protein ABBQ38_012253 [Trebouxia sp. C0009 RCD-2024]